MKKNGLADRKHAVYGKTPREAGAWLKPLLRKNKDGYHSATNACRRHPANRAAGCMQLATRVEPRVIMLVPFWGGLFCSEKGEGQDTEEEKR